MFISSIIDKITRAFLDNNRYLYFLDGLKTTLIIAVGALLLGIFIGTIVAIVKIIPKKTKVGFFFEKLAHLYTTIIRGTPIVVQLLLIYFVVFASLRLNAVLVAVIVFGINSGAYVSEIMRSGILAVDKGQMEAGRSLGLTYYQTMGKIVLPQAVKNILPTLGNEFIMLLKETSVAGFITVVDLTKATQMIVSATYDAFVPYIVLAITYLLIVLLIEFGLRKLETRLRYSDNR
jgi:His/Glu/Gln/Arg/opine family amino acid ABC transporter permease subunit